MSLPRYPKYKESGVEWLGEVPDHWEVKRFQRCVDVAEGQVDPEDAVYAAMSLIAPNHVESGTGRLLGLESASEQGAESGKYLCTKGDVVYSKIRPALRKACIAPEDCLCSADMYPLRAHSGLGNPFLLVFMLSEQFSSLAVLESQRVAMPKINRESLKEISLVVPPIAEQAVIAAFLDRETAKIDALVGEQQRLIELLKEKRQAVISHAVTKGLDPDAPMKDSGIEWLGEVPAHWRTMRLRRLFRQEKRQGYTGKSVLSVYRDYGVIPKDSRDDNINKTPEDLSAYQLVNPGDLVVNKMKAWQGSLGVSEYEGITSPDYAVFTPIGSENRGFLHLLLRGQQMVSVYRGLSSGIRPDQWRIEPGEFLGLTVFLPPLGEQAAISRLLDAQTAKFDTLTAEAQRAIDLLQERRTALISAAVTGQIDVRSPIPRA